MIFELYVIERGKTKFLPDVRQWCGNFQTEKAAKAKARRIFKSCMDISKVEIFSMEENEIIFALRRYD